MSLIQQEKSDMALLTADEAQTLLKKVLSFSTADECEVTLAGGEFGQPALCPEFRIDQRVLPLNAAGRILRIRAETRHYHD
jgi:hypothetical protein